MAEMDVSGERWADDATEDATVTAAPSRQDLTPAIWLAFPHAHPTAGPEVWAALREGAVERIRERTLAEADAVARAKSAIGASA